MAFSWSCLQRLKESVAIHGVIAGYQEAPGHFWRMSHCQWPLEGSRDPGQTGLKPSTLIWTVDSSLGGVSGREQSAEDRHEDRQQKSYQREGQPQHRHQIWVQIRRKEAELGHWCWVVNGEPADVHPLSSGPGTLQVPVNISWKNDSADPALFAVVLVLEDFRRKKWGANQPSSRLSRSNGTFFK